MATKVKYDVRGVEPGRGGKVPPIALYTCVVNEAIATKSKAGNPMWKITYEISKGDYKGTFIYDYITDEDSQDWKRRMFLEAIGKVKSGSDKGARGTLDLDATEGTSVQVKVKHEDDEEFGKSAKVGSVMPMPEDDDDDDEDLDDDEDEDDDADTDDDDDSEDDDDDDDEDDSDDDDEDDSDDDEDDDEEGDNYDDREAWSLKELVTEAQERGLTIRTQKKGAAKRKYVITKLRKDDNEDDPFEG